MNYSKSQLRPIIEKYKIDVDNDINFKTIIELFDGQTNYHIWALKLFYSNSTDIETLKAIKDFSIKYQSMINNLALHTINAYKTPELLNQLIREMIGAKVIVEVKKSINQFNTNQRNMLRKYIFDTEDENATITPLEASDVNFIKKCDSLIRFNKLHIGIRQVVTNVMSASNDINELLNSINDSLNNNYIWEKESLLSFVKTDPRCKNVKVVFDEGSVVVLEVSDFPACHALNFGRAYWCVTRDEPTFNQYAHVNKRSKQFFYFDFSKDERCNVAHIGFTIDGKRFIYAHDGDNNCIISDPIFATVNGVTDMMLINDILKAAKVPMDCLAHLNGTLYEWSYDGFISFAKNKNYKPIWANKKGCFLYQIEDEEMFNDLLSNTTASYEALDKPETSIFGLIDLTKNPNDDQCMTIITCTKDIFGILSVDKMFDAFGLDIYNDNPYFTEIGLNIRSLIKKLNKKIGVEVKLHKYLSEMKEDEALELIEENPNIDINFLFQDMHPIFIASSCGMSKLVKAILQHKNFDMNVVNAIGEPLLQAFIYDYRRMIYKNDETKVEEYKSLIEYILNLPEDKYDFNKVNGNLDSPIMVAAESDSTSWIIEKLLTKNGICLNLKNDVNRNALENAKFFNSNKCIELLSE